jgi:pyruvate dehydrogenase E2 component (dihydrolipoamide acetyltransferase)
LKSIRRSPTPGKLEFRDGADAPARTRGTYDNDWQDFRMARLIEVRVPDMGNFSNVAVIDVLVKPGDAIEREASLVTVETEKATMDVPSDVAGVVEKIHVKKGGTVSAGDVVATVRSEGDASGAASASASGASQDAGASNAPGESDSAKAGAAEAGAGGAGGSGGSAGSAAATAGASAGSKQSRSDSDSGTDSRKASAPAATAASSSAAGAQRAASPAEAASSGPPTLSLIAGGRTDLAPIDEAGFSRAHAGPSVRRFARELGVDLTQVTGTGFKGRITHDDVKAYVKKMLSGAPAGGGAAARAGSGLPALPIVDFAAFGPVETQPLTRIQKISGPRLQASWVNIPHVTQFDEADITDLEDVRTKLKGKAAKEGIKLTPLAFIVRALVKTLAEFPVFNSSLDPSGANLVMKKYLHIGFAADTPNGLMVPVIRDVDKKDVYEIARMLAELSEKARGGKLKVTEMQGGCFSVSSLGGIGGTAFTPIINPPEVAILGVSRSSMKPVYKDGSFVPRLMLPLSLSYDHRVIDGAMAARFTTHLASVLSDPRQLTEAVP